MFFDFADHRKQEKIISIYSPQIAYQIESTNPKYAKWNVPIKSIHRKIGKLALVR